MRLWSVHPRYLDPQGLVALWREALLAQKVLQGLTRGYRHHPQLARFQAAAAPVAAIGRYLSGVAEEAGRRGYAFDADKIAEPAFRSRLPVTEGQVQYEWMHLKRKLRARSPAFYRECRSEKLPDIHPLFRVVPGPVAAWEKR